MKSANSTPSPTVSPLKRPRRADSQNPGSPETSSARALDYPPRLVHGTPITPLRLLDELDGGSFCVSYSAPGQLAHCIELLSPQSILLLDNGAYGIWRRGHGRIDREKYFQWANDAQELCEVAIAVIPDVIGGSEADNWQEAALAVRALSAFPERTMFVWHMHESLQRLAEAARLFNFLAIGSSQEFDVQRYPRRYRQRLQRAGDVIDDVERTYRRRPFIHLLRGIGVIHEFTRFDSADSTNIARNHHRTRGTPVHVATMAARLDARVRALWAAARREDALAGYYSIPLLAALSAPEVLGELIALVQRDPRWLNAER